MNRILLISSDKNDVAQMILRAGAPVTLVSHAAKEIPDGAFDSVCVLGGDSDRPLVLNARLRRAVERFREAGKPVFTEFVASVGGCYAGDPTEMTHHRMVFDGTAFPIKDLEDGDLLDGHFNHCLSYYFMPVGVTPVLSYHDYVCAHDHVCLDADQIKQGRAALWFLDPSTLVCGFRLCNFRRARLAPVKHWEALLTAILSFLCGEDVRPAFDPPVCEYRSCRIQAAADANEAVKRGLAWFSRSQQLRDGGDLGVYEGFSHLIRGQDGVQLRAPSVRTDCSAEVAGAFLFDYAVHGTEESYEIFRRIDDFCFSFMQIKDGAHKGMLRWTETAWETCYQDDAARAVLPTLLYQNFCGEAPHLQEAIAALAYLLDTTDENGLRVLRTDLCNLNEDVCADLRKAGTGIASAHYNAYYHAALLLAYRAGAPQRFLEVAQKGLSFIMGIYPDTQRETSETEECCRLIFPLSVLYGITKDPEHYQWLCRVTADLERFRHSSGGYAEWDTGYRAACARNHAGECALLANNGDPVCDLLYSNNWLPLGFAYAYLVTGEARFRVLWAEIASFLVSCQIHSEDENLDGAWTRAFDMSRWEAYGVPHDVGWAPCCIETGWTVGEILMGLQFMHVAERVVEKEK